jgi:hypothetical protein
MSEETITSFCAKHGGVPTRFHGLNNWTGYEINMRVDNKPVILNVAVRDSISPQLYFQVSRFIAQLRGACNVHKIKTGIFRNNTHIKPQSVNFNGARSLCVPLDCFDEFVSAMKLTLETLRAGGNTGLKYAKKSPPTLGGVKKIPPLKFHPVAEPQPAVCADTLKVGAKLLVVPSPVLSAQHSRSASPEISPVTSPQDSRSASPELPPVSSLVHYSSASPELQRVSSLVHYRSASPELPPVLPPGQGTFKDVLSHNIPYPREVFNSIVQTVRSQQLRLMLEARNGADQGKMRSCKEILSEILKHEKYLTLQASEWKDT